MSNAVERSKNKYENLKSRKARWRHVMRAYRVYHKRMAVDVVKRKREDALKNRFHSFLNDDTVGRRFFVSPDSGRHFSGVKAGAR